MLTQWLEIKARGCCRHVFLVYNEPLPQVSEGVLIIVTSNHRYLSQIAKNAAQRVASFLRAPLAAILRIMPDRGA